MYRLFICCFLWANLIFGFFASSSADLAGEIPSLGTQYRITNVYTNLVLALNTDDPEADNKAYFTRPYDGSASQHFEFEPVPGVRSDMFFMKNVQTDRYAQINLASYEEGAAVHEFPFTTQANAVFKFVHAGDDKMIIVIAHSGQCLRIRAPLLNASVVQGDCGGGLDYQIWRIESATPTCRVINGLPYRLTNRNSRSALVLEVPNGSRRFTQPYDYLILNQFRNADYQKFVFEKAGFAYVVTAKHSGQAIQVADGNYLDNIAVVQAPNRKAPAQKWRLEPALSDGMETGYCFLVADHSGKALDTQFRLSSEPGRPVVQSAKNAEALSQHWKVELA